MDYFDSDNDGLELLLNSPPPKGGEDDEEESVDIDGEVKTNWDGLCSCQTVY